ncbi:RM43 protein, partial [Chroicocephalus maculipennis]|nr:RM43 protein [Chroicocephalus maculipennis]
RYVRQLQRLQLLFSPTAADSRGARQFVEEAAVDFARQHPDVVLYGGACPDLPCCAAVNGTVREELIASKTSEEIKQLATKLAGQSGLDIIRIRKPFHTDNPSVQGQWHPLTNKPSALTVQGPRLQLQ